MLSFDSSAAGAAQADAGKISPIDFLKTLFEHTTQQVYVCSFPNDRDDEKQASERHIITRTPRLITSFIEKWDKPGRGLFFCVGTIKGAKRNKANVAETLILFVDIDFNKVEGLPPDHRSALMEVLRHLGRMRMLPSATVSSGNGVHAYWLLKEPLATQEDMERIEMVLRQLADVIAGDLAVCEVSRVMRMPGTHNTKEGAWTEVQITSFDPHREYELDDLEEWLSEQSPLLLRKKRERAQTVGQTVGETEDGDFFAQFAKEHGIRTPIDVEARLNAMVYMGSGDSSIHMTQIQCAASMLSRGHPVEYVVSVLLAATKIAAGEYGVRWNWKREERSIRKDCMDWVKKHPPEKKKVELVRESLKSIEGGKSDVADAVKSDAVMSDGVGKADIISPEQQQTSGGGNVVPMLPPKATILKTAQQHVQLGEAVLGHMLAKGEQMIVTKDGSWFYSKGVWELRVEPKWINVRIERACRALNFKNGTKLTNETRNWIERNPDLWCEDAIPWDQHGKIPTRSGLVDPLTGELEPARPDHFCTWRVEVDYDRDAKCKWWETMVSDIFGDRAPEEQSELVRVVQECIGAALIDKKPRSLSKAAVFWGIENLGKSGPLDVVAGLFGGAIGATIGSVESAHGLMPFARRLPWVLHEAFNGQWHFSSNIKSIITQEAVQINIKNGPMWTQIVRAPIFWATNFQPQFKEATRAIVSRMIVIEVSRKFDERNPVGAAAEALRRGYTKPAELIVATELPGVLNWAIAGLKRALERGSIELTATIEETADAIHRDSNLVAGFLEECVGFDRKARIRAADFCLAHSAWWMELKGEDRRLPTNEAISKALKAMGDGRIGMDRKEMRDTHSRYYCGIALNKAGLRYHKAAFESRMFEGKTATATDPEREVNGLIPVSWDTRPSVVKMRSRHKDSDAREEIEDD